MNTTLEYGDFDKYEILDDYLGDGKYAEVFLGKNKETQEKVVIKVLKSSKERRVKREVKFLKDVSGGPNIVKFYDLIKDPDTGLDWLVMEYADDGGMEYWDLTEGDDFTEFDIRLYIY